MSHDYHSAWNEEVTICCEVSPEYGGSYGQYFKKCPRCGDGSLFWPVITKFVYHPSSYERESEDRIKSLEQELNRQTARLK